MDVAEAYGGLQLDKVTSMVVSEKMSAAASFGATFGAQANLTILPLALFGTEAQKRKYLPEAAVGRDRRRLLPQRVGLGIRRARRQDARDRQPDGSFVLNGEKMWITNGGFADIFIVFAKVSTGGEHFTAFIVERAFPA